MIHIVMGLPGSGKTEVSKILEKQFQGVRINTDELYSHLFPDNKYINGDFPPGRLEQIYNSMGALAFYLEMTDPKKHYIFEGSFRFEAQRKQIKSQIKNKDSVKLMLVHVSDEKAIKERIDKRHAGGAPDTYEDYLKIKSVFEMPKEYYEIDNSGSLEELKRKVKDYAIRHK